MVAKPPSRWAHWRAQVATVRVRVTAVAVLVVGLALVAGAITIVAVLRRSLTDNVRTSAELRAQDVAEILESGTPPGGLAVDDEEDLLVQVLDADGRVVASTANVEGEPAVTALRPGRTARLSGLPIGDDEEFLVVAEGADAGSGSFTVLVGRSLESVGETTGIVSDVLMAGIPLLLLVVGTSAWLLTGRALAPVEGIRSEVAAISAAEMHRRIPHPPGHDEIARLADTMNEMLGRLEDSQARQRRFVSDASHELRSPVTTIRQHSEVARSHPEGTSVTDLADTVLAEDLRLEQLVEDLLWLARVDERTLRLHREPVDVDDVVLDEARRLRLTTPLDVDTADVSAGQVLGDRLQLRRMLRNLVDNAARHARGRVVLSLAETYGAVVLRVDDDGPGIPVEHRVRVFERFVRLDDARTRDGGGSGLGLAVVAEIAAAHGGSVTVGDSPLGGARFEMRVPANGD